MERLLLAFDGSPAAWQGLDRAAQLARSTGAAVGIVHVAPVERPDELTEPLRAAHDALAARGIDAQTFAVFGDPAEEIGRLALEGKFDAIVLGSEPRGRLRRLVDGSVSLRLASDVPVSVIIARST